MLAFGLIACFASAFGQTFYIALFNGEWRQEFGLTHGELGALYSGATLASGLTLIYLGRLLDDIPLVGYTLSTVAAFAAGCVLIANVSAGWMLLPAIFLTRLCGQGLMGHIAVSSMARFFDRTRGKAIAIATLGFPLGEALFPIAVVALAAHFGWRELWYLAGAFLLVAILPSLWALPRGNPHVRQKAVQSAIGSTREDVLRDPRFYGILPVVLASPFIITGMFFHQVALADTQGWPLALLASAFIAFAVTQTGSSLLAGILIDRYGARNLMRFFLLPMAAGIGLLTLSDASWVPFVYLGLAGMTAGANGALGGALWAELYGIRHIGAIRAMLTALMVFSTAASPWIMGVALDGGWTILELATVMAVYSAVAGPLLGGVVRSKPPHTGHA